VLAVLALEVAQLELLYLHDLGGRDPAHDVAAQHRLESRDVVDLKKDESLKQLLQAKQHISLDLLKLQLSWPAGRRRQHLLRSEIGHVVSSLL
jgi:hypothetical protein